MTLGTDRKILTLDADIFADITTREGLQVVYGDDGYQYASRKQKDDWILLRAKGPFDWNVIPVSTGVTADPAAGAQLADVTVPTGKKWLWLGGYTSVVNDGTAADRYMNLQFKPDGTNSVYIAISAAAITAGLTRYFIEGPHGIPGTAISGYVMMPTPVGGVELPAGSKISHVYAAIQAGDNIGVYRYYYKEAPA